MKNTMQILHVSPPNWIFGGENLMVVVSRAMGHYKETFKLNSYVAFNHKDFSLPERYTKKERIKAENHFNYKLCLEASKSGEIDANTPKTFVDTTIGIDTQTCPSRPTSSPKPSPNKEPTPDSPQTPPVPDPFPLPIPTSRTPRTFVISHNTTIECEEIFKLPIKAHLAYLHMHTLDESIVETPI